MSHSRKPIHELNFDSVSNRFADSLSLTRNKPDFKELDLGSPVSPLVTRGAAVNPTTSSNSSSSSSGSATGKLNSTQLAKNTNHSGELSSQSGSGVNQRNSKPGHRRSVSAGAPLIYSGSSFSTVSSCNSVFNGNGSHSVSSTANVNILPSGNICPSGKILKTGMVNRVANRTETLGLGTGHYGHGSIMRGNTSNMNTNTNANNYNRKLVMDAEEVKRAGNEMYKKGNFAEALKLYDKAISMSPENAAFRSNRAAALTAFGSLTEAVKECEEAVRLDPAYGRAHQRLVSLYLRLGQAENARRHLCFAGQHPDPAELQKLQSYEKHVNRCADARKIGDWKIVLREIDAAIAIGADSSPQLIACKAEALVKLHKFEEADSCLSNMPKFVDNSLHSPSHIKFFGMDAEAYFLYVRSQVDMALGRYENAIAVAEKAGLIDISNVEIATFLKNAKMAARARSRGTELFSSGRYEEACSAYGEGLKYDGCNAVLYCNRAVCWSKLGLCEKCIEDCNEALRIQPNYTKALLLRAAQYKKLGRWLEALKDYEVLRRERPGDNEVAESLQRAKRELNKTKGEVANAMKSGGEVEEIRSLNKFKSAVASPGVSVVHFKMASSEVCEEISPFVNMLCVRYPSVRFYWVDVEECMAVAKAESIRRVPTFKIYKNGEKVKEMINPKHQLLEESVKYYINSL